MITPILSWIFDIDGVITNLEKKEISEPILLPLLAQRLKKKETIGFISGRPVSWQIEKVIRPLERYLQQDMSLLSYIYLSGEFGSVSATFENTAWHESISALALPPKLIANLTEATRQFEPYVFIDHDKKTQFTVEKKIMVDTHTFITHRHTIANLYKQIILQLGLDETIEVHEDQIAINVKNRYANKSQAIKQFLLWLQAKKRMPETFTVFGDTISDLEMGTALHAENLPFHFVYVGNPENLTHATLQFTPLVTQARFDKGTAEALSNMVNTPKNALGR